MFILLLNPNAYGIVVQIICFGYCEEFLLSIQALKIAVGHYVAHFDMLLSFMSLTDVLIKEEESLFSANTQVFKVGDVTFPKLQLGPQGQGPFLFTLNST